MQKLKKPEEGGSGKVRRPKDAVREFAAQKDRAERILFELADLVRQRRVEPEASSYTSKMVGDRGKVSKKVLEESFELLTAEGKKEVVWEGADLLYFFLVYLENRGVPLMDVFRELVRRRDSEKPNQRYASIPD